MSIVRIFESELSYIVEETISHEEIETGGSLFGLWTHGGNPTILLASRPGPRAVRQVTQFEQDAEAHRLMEGVMIERFGAQSVGLWHSHHQLGLHELSGGDVRRTMKFARRNDRARFCDLLSYFSEGGRRSSRSSEVTVKPYVYVDASNGRRAPTSVTVLPGMSPVRTALGTETLSPKEAAVFKVALAAPSQRPPVAIRLARSIELANRDDEDDSVQAGRGFWPFRKGSTGGLTGVEREGVAVAETEDLGRSAPAIPASVTRQASADPSAERLGGEPFLIPDLERYIHDYVEPALRGMPRSITCELEPISDGKALRLTLLSAAQSEEHQLDLGWDGAVSVITRHIVRLAQEPRARDLIERGEVRSAAETIRELVQDLGRADGWR